MVYHLWLDMTGQCLHMRVSPLGDLDEGLVIKLMFLSFVFVFILFILIGRNRYLYEYGGRRFDWATYWERRRAEREAARSRSTPDIVPKPKPTVLKVRGDLFRALYTLQNGIFINRVKLLKP